MQRLKHMGQQVNLFVRAGIRRLWRFAGRLGLALRKLLTWFFWIPLVYVTMPIWLPVQWTWEIVSPVFSRLWRFIGRMGTALRKLLWWGVWQPFDRIIRRPAIWLYQWAIRPFSITLTKIVWRILIRMWGIILAIAGWFMQKTAPRRHLLRRRLRSRWIVLQARWRVRWKRPSYPHQAEVIPSVPQPASGNPRVFRLATAIATIALLFVVGLLSMRERQADAASESTGFLRPQIIVLTPTPLPPTIVPTNTPEIILTPWPTPDPTTGGGTIAFSQHIDGNTDIYILPVGQAEPVRLTTHPAVDRDPAWSPDGSRLAFSSNRDGNWDIYVYDIPRGELIRVTQAALFDGHPTWSPDGNWLAYESYRNDNFDIFLTKVDGSVDPLPLTRNEFSNYAPVWEPVNGRHIAFTSRRNGTTDIFIRSLDDPLAEYVVNVTHSQDFDEGEPVFSANGRFLAYAQQQGDIDIIYAVPLNDAYEPAGAAQSLGQQGHAPAWSPDNESLVSVYERNGRSYLVAGNAQAWGVTPQVYVSNGRIDSTSWTAVNLTPDMASGMVNIDRLEEDKPLFVEARADSGESSGTLALLYEIPVNAPSPYLSDRVDQSFTSLRARLIADAGWDVLGRLDNMFESLNAGALPGQSNQTWNKAGRAFDLSYRDAIGLDPQIEVVREDIGTETFWRIYVRTAAQDGTQGEPLRDVPWDFRARSGDDPRYFDQGGKLRDEIPAGYYVDFTAVAADYGWTRVSSGPNWRTYFPDILFWHYENHQGLNWEDAMRELYLEDELAGLFDQ